MVLDLLNLMQKLMYITLLGKIDIKDLMTQMQQILEDIMILQELQKFTQVLK
jgi:hypothetical protein